MFFYNFLLASFFLFVSGFCRASSSLDVVDFMFKGLSSFNLYNKGYKHYLVQGRSDESYKKVIVSFDLDEVNGCRRLGRLESLVNLSSIREQLNDVGCSSIVDSIKKLAFQVNGNVVLLNSVGSSCSVIDYEPVVYICK